MRLTRPAHLLVQCRDRPEFSLDSLLRGGAGLVERSEWLALAPHLDAPVPLCLDALAVLDAVPPEGIEAERLRQLADPAQVDHLVEVGLLLADDDRHAALRERESRWRGTPWWTPAAVAQAFGRWQGVDVAADEARQGKRSLAQLIGQHGPPPAETTARSGADTWTCLPAPDSTALDELLAARNTCRNFDLGAELPLAQLSRVLWLAFGAQARQSLAPDAAVLKKHSPSGGGLHPIEAYVLVQRVAGLAPGAYHYQCLAHALEPVRGPGGSLTDVRAAAHELVAGQRWFADAPVLVLMAARFGRSFWKYRNHAKAWRVLQLDAGHLSQTLALAATEQGLGAFITAAINDEAAERLFGLDGALEGPVAVCGFGPRSPERRDNELDPLGKTLR